MIISGRVVSGRGEGKKFLSMEEYKAQIRKVLFEPYPGTLNLYVGRQLSFKKDYSIKGFEKNGKKFGGVELVVCKIEGKKGAIIFPEIGGYKEILEIIAPFHIRTVLNKKDGDEIRVEV